MTERIKATAFSQEYSFLGQHFSLEKHSFSQDYFYRKLHFCDTKRGNRKNPQMIKSMREYFYEKSYWPKRDIFKVNKDPDSIMPFQI